jgi:hypothetical protein
VSFRRDTAAAREWRAWVRKHEAELVACGVPREVRADELTWWRFVEHGYHPPVSAAREVRFRPDELSAEQQRRLYALLDSVLPADRGGCALWYDLHRRYGPADEPNLVC